MAYQGKIYDTWKEILIMKRRARILCLLVSALIVFALLPLQGSTATNYEKVFDNLTFATAITYDKAPPAKGTKTSAAEINRTLASIGYKVLGSGTIFLDKTLVISKSNGAISDVTKYANWKKITKKTSDTYREYTTLVQGGVNPIYCDLEKYVGNTYDYWFWEKDTDTGLHTTGTGPMPSSTDKYKPQKGTYKKYKDAKVLGQKCFVFSFQEKGSSTIEYIYISYKNGLLLKTVVYSSKGNYSTTITFVVKKVKTVPHNFDYLQAAPTVTTWTEI